MPGGFFCVRGAGDGLAGGGFLGPGDWPGRRRAAAFWGRGIGLAGGGRRLSGAGGLAWRAAICRDGDREKDVRRVIFPFVGQNNVLVE